MFIFNRISSQEKMDFIKGLSIMLRSGIAIDEALVSLATQTKSKVFRNSIYKVKHRVEMGVSLSEAFNREQNVFGSVYIGLLKAGEASGTLVENLSFLADWLERNHNLHQEIRAAMFYPKFVLVTTFLLGGGLSVFILPRLIPLFQQLRVELPLATQLLLSFSLFIEKYWYAVLVGIILLIIGLRFISRYKPVRRVFHLLHLKTPFIGGLMTDYQLALVSQLFFTLFKSGLSINESLEITGEAVTNIRYQDSIEKIRQRVLKGTTLSYAMSEYPKLYPKNMIHIIANGEESGTLDDSFLYLTEFYSKEVSNKVKKLPIIIEPILLIVIAIVVGFVALSIITPIYELTRGIR
ncbi:hypothetical protein COB64_03260 [Candidatus Wolfebacteria bacterium]|nr:MAG: hypothetical protein COB64_03260 [Candidatus Wolfebacteria bacterium]